MAKTWMGQVQSADIINPGQIQSAVDSAGEKEAASRRATDALVLEDTERLIAA